MIRISINHKLYNVEYKEQTIMQLADELAIKIPRLCYHKAIGAVSRCRMCVVEIVSENNRLAPSCSTVIAENMEILTDSEKVIDARRKALDLILASHKTNCLECSCAGDCDLQNYVFDFGNTSSKISYLSEYEEKNIHPLIKMDTAKCINCGKCVNFFKIYTKNPEMGEFKDKNGLVVHLLNDNEMLKSHLSGNIIDLCPVGAITIDNNYEKYRSYEVELRKTINATDAIGDKIIVKTKEHKPVEITAALDFIDDKTRFSYDALFLNRIDAPYIRKGEVLRKVSFDEAFEAIKSHLKLIMPSEMAFLSSGYADLESLWVLKKLAEKLKVKNIDVRAGFNYNIYNKKSYLFNLGISNLKYADAVVLIGTELETEAPTLIPLIINARVFKPKNLTEIKEINLDEFKTPAFIVGQSIFLRDDALAALDFIYKAAKNMKVIKKGRNAFNVLHLLPNTVGALNLKIANDKINQEQILLKVNSSKIKFLYLLNPFNIPDFNKEKCLMVYQGIHFNDLARKADIILPGTAFTEKKATFVNTEEVFQKTLKICAPYTKECLDDYKIITDLALKLNVNLGFSDVNMLRGEMEEFLNITQEEPQNVNDFKAKINFAQELKPLVQNYYDFGDFAKMSHNIRLIKNAFNS